MNATRTPPRHETAPSGRLEHPTTVTDAAQVLREADGTVLFRGGATKLDWAGRVDVPDLVLDTTHLQGILTHNPADMTASVRAGTTLTALQEHLAADRQWLALDPSTAQAGATIGGLLAAGDSGPSRLRYGALRDLVIGVTLVLADGTVARSGGHVIKNVAGYDLAKLVHGSLGSLALVAEVVVRLHPRPATSVTTAAVVDATAATTAALSIAASPLEPAAVEWVSDGDSSGHLYVRIDGTASFVEASAQRLVTLLAGLGISASPLSADDARSAWQSHSSAVLGADHETVVRVAGLPSDLGSLAGHARQVAAAAGLEAQLMSSVALGLQTVRLRGGAPAAQAQAFTAIRERALQQGASVLLRTRPPELDDLVDALGPAPSTVQLLRRIKTQFDPTSRCAPGRFQPWY